jgi:hypothetical protein
MEAKVIHNVFVSFAFAPLGFDLLRGLFFPLCCSLPCLWAILSEHLLFPASSLSVPHSGQRQLFGILELTTLI